MMIAYPIRWRYSPDRRDKSGNPSRAVGGRNSSGGAMTWQGGKRPREAPPRSMFARLAPLVGHDKAGNLEATLHGLAAALKGAKTKGRLHLRLVGGTDKESVDHWEIAGGKAR